MWPTDCPDRVTDCGPRRSRSGRSAWTGRGRRAPRPGAQERAALGVRIVPFSSPGLRGRERRGDRRPRLRPRGRRAREPLRVGAHRRRRAAARPRRGGAPAPLEPRDLGGDELGASARALACRCGCGHGVSTTRDGRDHEHAAATRAPDAGGAGAARRGARTKNDEPQRGHCSRPCAPRPQRGTRAQGTSSAGRSSANQRRR